MYLRVGFMKAEIGYVAGLAVIVLYCIFTFTSWALFPTPYSPTANWLSDLGNSSLNPAGAMVYNIGCIFTGIALFPFFIGLNKWYTNEKWRENSIKITQLVGFAAAFALMMIGFFSEDAGWLHSMWSTIFFLLNLAVLILASASLYTHPSYMKSVALYGFVVAAINLLFLFVSNTPILEWFTVFTALGYIGLLSYNMIKFKHTSENHT